MDIVKATQKLEALTAEIVQKLGEYQELTKSAIERRKQIYNEQSSEWQQATGGRLYFYKTERMVSAREKIEQSIQLLSED